jgi:hypothetical protein
MGANFSASREDGLPFLTGSAALAPPQDTNSLMALPPRMNAGTGALAYTETQTASLIGARPLALPSGGRQTARPVE